MQFVEHLRGSLLIFSQFSSAIFFSFADRAFVDAKHGFVRLMFGQSRVTGDALRSLVVLHIVPRAVGAFLRSCREFGPSVRRFLESSGQPPEPIIQLQEEPDQTIALSANVLLSAFADAETVIDCYNISPFALREITTTQTFSTSIDPVVRVQMPTSLFVALLDSLEALPDLRAGGDANE